MSKPNRWWSGVGRALLLVACGVQAQVPGTGGAWAAASAPLFGRGASLPLSQAPLTQQANGWGPAERDRSNGEQAAGDGRPLTLGGRTYARGFGTHAGSSLGFDLAGRCRTFAVQVGVDDEVGSRGSVVFGIEVDGRRVWDSGRMTGDSATRTARVSVAGARSLRLVASDAGDGPSFDHADWAEPLLQGCAAGLFSAPASAAPAQPGGYSGPLVITRGGTYSGRWESTDPAVPAVTVRTSEPVVLAGARLRGPGPLVTGWSVDLTLRGVQAESLTPNVPGRAADMAVKVEEVRNLRVEHSTFRGGGIYVRRFLGDAARGQGIRILFNTFRNIDGRQSDGRGGHNGQVSIRQAVQFNDVTRVAGAEIGWNEIVNEPGRSAVEDNINMYLSSGTPASPIRIHDNYVQGAYPADPQSDRYSGGGILLGDGKATDPLGNGYQLAENNVVVATTNYGVAIIGGRGSVLRGNRAVASGRTAQGRLPAQNVGMYVWDMYGAGKLSPSTFGSNRAENNVLGWTKVGADGRTSNNPMWLPHCAVGGGACANNSSLGSVDPGAEQAEAQRWQARLGAAGLRTGVE